MEPIQILAIAFSLFCLSILLIRFRDNKLTLFEFFLWVVIWLAVIFFAINPNITGWVSSLFGVRRPIDLVVYVSIVLIIFLLFKLFERQESMQREITKVVREVAKNKKNK